ncbi:probable receptor-like protein kinase At5g24010 [Carya illinoinensis]|uniref:Protein kinase domain-containing protein n=1 Tax=Carya illinoinensis TaxID=32201 RepID=A0A8T1R6Z1_CARIL|nr:probable receptor-like protein kinase At5g24010 [Carya illinoinensis]KAG6663140.1 hypothetical protein CIPAW_02G005600 [Carya illinoinensis]
MILMEMLRFFKVLFPLFFLLLSPAYTLPNKYFINCGSKSNITVGGRSFLGDLNSGSFSVGPSSIIVATESSLDTSLYQTARIFTNRSSFEFDIIDIGIHYVRIHFFPFVSGRVNLADARFDVSVSNFSLLSNFGVKSIGKAPVIKEYLLTINGSKFNIHFNPGRKSFAFVSAIEVFRLPDQEFVGDNIDLGTLGQNNSYRGVRSQVLHTIHRVNVGGPETNDTLWRNWIPDHNYLLPTGSAKTCVPYEGTLLYDINGASNYSASDLVYKTCRELNLDYNGGSSNSPNITWRFEVSRSATHLVRLHFCDIVSQNSEEIYFNLYFYGNIGAMISTFNLSGTRAAPLYYDFVVDSDDSGSMNMSVGPNQDSIYKTAYLNGVEIMEFMKEASLVPSGSKEKKTLHVIVGTVCGLAFVVILVVLFLMGLKCNKANHGDGVGSLPFFHGKGSPGKGAASASPVRNLNLKLRMPLLEILDATHNFDTKLLIGEGGFGKVYRGYLRSGMTVAVKRSDPKRGQGLPEFETEVLVLSRIRHRHLVSLYGYCEEKSEMILVYEFMENGSLRDHIYHSNDNSDSEGPSKRSKLSWKQRLEICIGSAKGLHYLHSCSSGGIIHRDVKSANILLNKHYVAKVADFGLSRSGPLDPDHISVGIKGSFGYMDPEYFRSLQFTDKSDVYSFGVVLLEVLCARPAIINSPNREEVNLAEWGRFWQNKGQLEKIIDPSLVGEINPNSLRKFGETAEKCLKGDGASRPTMLDVLWDLEYALQLHQTAVHKEPHEDTGTNALLELPLLTIQHLPSKSIPDWGDDNVSMGSKGIKGLDTTNDGSVLSV